MQLVNSSQAASLVCPAFGTAAFAKIHSFQDPKNFTYIVDSNNHVQTLPHRLRHQDKDIITAHITSVYILIIDFKLLKST